MTGTSFFALFSFALQDALLGTTFNWVTPSFFSGVSFLSLWAVLCVLSIVFPVVVFIFGSHWARDSVKGQAWCCEGLDRREETIYPGTFLYLMTFVYLFCVNGFSLASLKYIFI